MPAMMAQNADVIPAMAKGVAATTNAVSAANRSVPPKAFSKELGQLKRRDEARRYLDEVIRLRPDFSLAFVRHGHLFGEREIMAHFCDGLSKAKVPEKT
jgi:hypothetical protein